VSDRYFAHSLFSAMSDQSYTVVCPNPFHRSTEVEVAGQTHQVSFESDGEVAKATGLSKPVADALLEREGYRPPESRQDATVTADLEKQRPSVLEGIGPAREEALQEAGIETVAGLSGAAPGLVADALSVSEDTAETLIGRAVEHTAE